MHILGLLVEYVVGDRGRCRNAYEVHTSELKTGGWCRWKGQGCIQGIHYDLQEKGSSNDMLVCKCIHFLVTKLSDSNKPLVLSDNYLQLCGEDVRNLLYNIIGCVCRVARCS